MRRVRARPKGKKSKAVAGYANSSFVEWLHDFDSANVRLGQKERAVDGHNSGSHGHGHTFNQLS